MSKPASRSKRPSARLIFSSEGLIVTTKNSVYLVTYTHTMSPTDVQEEKLFITAPEIEYVAAWCQRRNFLFGQHSHTIELLGSIDVAIDVTAGWHP